MTDLTLNSINRVVVGYNRQQASAKYSNQSFGGQKDSFEIAENQQSSSKPEMSFYKKYKPFIWALAGLISGELISRFAFGKLYKSYPFAVMLLSVPLDIAGMIAGNALALRTERKNEKQAD